MEHRPDDGFFSLKATATCMLLGTLLFVLASAEAQPTEAPQPTAQASQARFRYHEEVSEALIGNHVIKFDSERCGLAIEVAVQTGHESPEFPAPSEFCKRQLARALDAAAEIPKSSSGLTTPAPKYTPRPLQ